MCDRCHQIEGIALQLREAESSFREQQKNIIDSAINYADRAILLLHGGIQIPLTKDPPFEKVSKISFIHEGTEGVILAIHI